MSIRLAGRLLLHGRRLLSNWSFVKLESIPLKEFSISNRYYYFIIIYAISRQELDGEVDLNQI